MKRLSAIGLGIIIGGGIEAFLACFLEDFGQFGRVAPTDVSTALLLLTQLPGVLIAILVTFVLSKWEETIFPILIVATNVIWMSAVAYGILRIRGRSRPK